MDSVASVCMNLFRKDHSNHVHAKLFSDIDECTLGTDTCAHNCLDIPGSYTCSCRPGYALNADGITCNGKKLLSEILLYLLLWSQMSMSARWEQIDAVKIVPTLLAVTHAAAWLDTLSIVMGAHVMVRAQYVPLLDAIV